jgi:hypothetical protein
VSTKCNLAILASLGLAAAAMPALAADVTSQRLLDSMWPPPDCVMLVSHAGQSQSEDRHVDADFNALAQPLVHVLLRDRPVWQEGRRPSPTAGRKPAGTRKDGQRERGSAGRAASNAGRAR